MTRMNVEPSKLSNIEDAVALVRDTAAPMLADASGCVALLYADWSWGSLISETVWPDPQALAASQSAHGGRGRRRGSVGRHDRRYRGVPAGVQLGAARLSARWLAAAWR